MAKNPPHHLRSEVNIEDFGKLSDIADDDDVLHHRKSAHDDFANQDLKTLEVCTVRNNQQKARNASTEKYLPYSQAQRSAHQPDKGILIHSLSDLFSQVKRVEQEGSSRVVLRCSYFEIYND